MMPFGISGGGCYNDPPLCCEAAPGALLASAAVRSCAPSQRTPDWRLGGLLHPSKQRGHSIEDPCAVLMVPWADALSAPTG